MDSKNEHLADSLLELRHKINAELIFGIYQREETKFHLEMIHVSSSQHQILGESSGLDREIPASSDG